MDLHALAESEYPIARELENWAQWLQPRERRQTSPMFRLYQTPARARSEYGLTRAPSVRALDAMTIERKVAELHRASPIHATVLRWYYVHEARSIGSVLRRLGYRMAELAGALRDARQRLAQLLVQPVVA